MKDKNGAAGIDPELVRELAGILKDSGLSEIEVEHGELKLRLARGAPVAAAPMAYAPAPGYAPAYAPAPAHVAHAPAPEPAKPADLRAHPGAVLSPMVGTAYLSPEPGASAFIKVGDTVSEGQTLLIVEAMKTFNPIPAPRAGKVTQIIVTDAQPVEFGEALVVLE
ncbi:MAG: acetyl-CoA carboxylase biotin carboxyl carrier protein [Alphaproteobacteria bacterium]|nr:acetyl-CoA carboxylase biotin carboxyl carrier protein [Alphaproteobacteria bacterium]